MNFIPVSSKKRIRLRNLLLRWYAINKRDLPWRETSDPYKVWLSEIVLQQTRVDQGLEYFHRLITRYPDICSLAASTEDELLKHWQGLGYYSRARNMHRAATIIEKEYHGVFPSTYRHLLSLPGTGPYTAAAVASIAYNEPRTAVDGNVLRVLSRLFGITEPVDKPAGKKAVEQLAEMLLDREAPGVFNQALMDFGALQCIPTKPQCPSCPLNRFCRAFELNLMDQLPVKAVKVKMTKRYFHYLFIKVKENSGVYLRKRTGKDIWEGLYEFPCLETQNPEDFVKLIKRDDWQQMMSDSVFKYESSYGPVIHQLTHQRIHAFFHTISLVRYPRELPRDWLFVPFEKLFEYPVPVLLERFLSRSPQNQNITIK